MLIKIQVQYEDIDDFVLFSVFHSIVIITFVYREGVLGKWYFAYIDGNDEIHRLLDGKYKIISIVTK